MPNIGTPELIVILLIILVLFGGKKLPELAKSIGKSVKEFRDGLKGDKDEKKKEDTKTETKKKE